MGRWWLPSSKFTENAVFAGAVMGALFWGAYFLLGQYRFYSISVPSLFTPDLESSKKYVFVRESPQEIIRYYETYTMVQANKLVARYIGNKIAITGRVDNVNESVFNAALDVKQRSVYLQNRNQVPFVGLYFNEEWISRIENQNKGDAIFAYCTIETISGFSIYLERLRACSTVIPKGAIPSPQSPQDESKQHP